jgi:hypothetical protein
MDSMSEQAALAARASRGRGWHLVERLSEGEIALPGNIPIRCQGQRTFDPFRQLEMDPPILYSENESVFQGPRICNHAHLLSNGGAKCTIRGSGYQGRSVPLRSLDTRFL